MIVYATERVRNEASEIDLDFNNLHFILLGTKEVWSDYYNSFEALNVLKLFRASYSLIARCSTEVEITARS